jgi:peptidoglycan/LPS O-acetylase OafA/YrhL
LVSLLAASAGFAIRSRAPRRLARDVALAGAAFLLVLGGVLAAFVARGGWNPVIEDNHLLLTGLAPETREFLVAFSGIRDWRAGVAEMVYSAAMWLGVFLLIELFSTMVRKDAASWRRRVPLLLALLIVLGGAATLGGAGGAVVFSAAPLVCLASVAVGVRRGRGARAAALVAFGLSGLLLSFRRPFHIADSAYVGPPLLFAVVSAAGLLRVAVARYRSRSIRHRLRVGLAFTTAALVALSFAARTAGYLGDPRVPVPGTGGMLSARLDVAREIEQLADALRRATSGGEGIVVIPEGEILNYLSRRPNPVRHKLYIPGYLTDANERDVLAELAAADPAAVVLWNRPTGEYGRAQFGEEYGVFIARWIDQHYAVRPFVAGGAPPRRYARFRYGTRHRSPIGGEPAGR